MRVVLSKESTGCVVANARPERARHRQRRARFGMLYDFRSFVLFRQRPCDKHDLRRRPGDVVRGPGEPARVHTHTHRMMLLHTLCRTFRDHVARCNQSDDGSRDRFRSTM